MYDRDATQKNWQLDEGYAEARLDNANLVLVNLSLERRFVDAACHILTREYHSMSVSIPPLGNG